MKNLVSLITVFMLSTLIHAQQLTPEVQKVFDVCKEMRAAIGAGNKVQLKEASNLLKKCDVKYWGLPRRSTDEPSLDGHYIFDAVFADSLIDNSAVYKFAQRYADRLRHRGTSAACKAFVRNLVIKKNSSAKYTISAKGQQDIAVVAEPKGMVTLRIHDKTNDKWHNDKTNETKGEPCRKQILLLPQNKRCIIEIEIINTSKRDISVALIGN